MRGNKGFSLVKRGAAAAALIALLWAPAAGAVSSGADGAAVKAANYVKSLIHEDGGFGAQKSTVTETSQAITALRIADTKLPAAKDGKGPIDYLKENVKTVSASDKAVENAGTISQLIMALVAADQNPKDFAGTDWVALLKSGQENATGLFGDYAINHIGAMLALESAGEEIPGKAVSWLINNQEENGGFALSKKGEAAPDTNTTAVAIQALIGAGEKKDSAPIKEAVAFLKTQQNTDSGFPFVTPSEFGTASDSSSTAWVIQGLLAAGEDVGSQEWAKSSVSPTGYLLSLQNADGGFMYQAAVPESSLLSTCQAIPALMGQPFPFKGGKAKSDDTKDTEKTGGSARSAVIWIIAGLAVVAGGGMFFLFRKNSGA
jgi:hypothetical protein